MNIKILQRYHLGGRDLHFSLRPYSRTENRIISIFHFPKEETTTASMISSTTRNTNFHSRRNFITRKPLLPPTDPSISRSVFGAIVHDGSISRRGTSLRTDLARYKRPLNVIIPNEYFLPTWMITHRDRPFESPRLSDEIITVPRVYDNFRPRWKNERGKKRGVCCSLIELW